MILFKESPKDSTDKILKEGRKHDEAIKTYLNFYKPSIKN